jgi:hypothetical protein
MKEMPSRDTTGKCEGECRDRVIEGEEERQKKINQEAIKYDSPASKSPTWTSDRDAPPGSMGGRI